jgi:hypothetical protein
MCGIQNPDLPSCLPMPPNAESGRNHASIRMGSVRTYYSVMAMQIYQLRATQWVGVDGISPPYIAHATKQCISQGLHTPLKESPTYSLHLWYHQALYQPIPIYWMVGDITHILHCQCNQMINQLAILHQIVRTHGPTSYIVDTIGEISESLHTELNVSHAHLLHYQVHPECISQWLCIKVAEFRTYMLHY